MYKKNLTSEFRLRLTDEDMNFLRELSADRGISVSEVVRSIISEYRRSCDLVSKLDKAVNLVSTVGGLSNGDTKTDFDN